MYDFTQLQLYDLTLLLCMVLGFRRTARATLLQLFKVQPYEAFASFLCDCRTAQKRYGSTSNMLKLLVKKVLWSRQKPPQPTPCRTQQYLVFLCNKMRPACFNIRTLASTGDSVVLCGSGMC